MATSLYPVPSLESGVGSESQRNKEEPGARAIAAKAVIGVVTGGSQGLQI